MKVPSDLTSARTTTRLSGISRNAGMYFAIFLAGIILYKSERGDTERRNSMNEKNETQDESQNLAAFNRHDKSEGEVSRNQPPLAHMPTTSPTGDSKRSDSQRDSRFDRHLTVKLMHRSFTCKENWQGPPRRPTVPGFAHRAPAYVL